MEMRQVFGSELEKIMTSDERIVVLDADLAKANGTMGLRKVFPDRAIDLGVAEQNMASVSAGLASYGFIPFITTFTPFASRRIFDQAMISIAYAKQNVKIVGTDPGITAELNGGTHMSFEDVGIMRTIPGMVIFEPSDCNQLSQALPQIIDFNGPVYIRLFRKSLPELHDQDYKFNLFKADVLRVGTDITIIASGNLMLQNALNAAKILSDQGVNAEIIDVHTIKPIDSETILKSAQKTKRVLTCENHNIHGGLFSAVSEALIGKVDLKFDKIGIFDQFGQVGKAAELVEVYKLSVEEIVMKAQGLMR